MLIQKLRDYATHWLVYIIFGIIFITFGFFGTSYYFKADKTLPLVVVGNSVITYDDFQNAYRQLTGSLGSNAYLELDIKDKVTLLQQLINENLLIQVSQKYGFKVSNHQISKFITDLPIFHTSTDRKFDKVLYENMIRRYGFTIKSFENRLSQSLSAKYLRDSIINTAFLTKVELDKITTMLLEQRVVEFILLPFKEYLDKITIQDSDAKEFFANNTKHFTSPEKVKIQFLELEMSNIKIPVPDEQVLINMYQATNYRYQYEERVASYILIKTAKKEDLLENNPEKLAEAESLLMEIKSGRKNFHQMMLDAKFETGSVKITSNNKVFSQAEKAIISMNNIGEISDIVKDADGFKLLRLDAILSKVPTFEEVRMSLIRDFQQSEAEKKFFEISKVLTEYAYEYNSSIEPAAKVANLPIQESTFFSRSDGYNIANISITDVAFSHNVLEKGLNSDLITLKPGHILLMRVKERQNAKLSTFEEARNEIYKILKSAAAHKQLTETSMLIKKIATQNNKSLKDLSIQFGGVFTGPLIIRRTDHLLFDPNLLSAVFKKPKTIISSRVIDSVMLHNGDHAVFAVKFNQHNQNQHLFRTEYEQLAQACSHQIGLSQFSAFVKSLRQQLKIITYAERM